MKIWIDLANSPQVLFFRPIIKEFHKRGYQTLITTRAYAQTVELTDKLNFPHTQIGKHGGEGMLGLAGQMTLRAFHLLRWARDQQFDLAVSHNAYSQICAARILRIPTVTLMDYEHQPLNHLSFRLAHKVIVPEAFPEEHVQRFGAAAKTLKYPGIKEQLYLADFVPERDFRKLQGFPTNKPLIIVRPPATWTAYHRFENDLFGRLLNKLTKSDDHYLLLLPRIPEQSERLQAIPNVHIADTVYDGPNLLFHADAVISGGGTMNREAAVLGTPTYTLFRGKLAAVDQHLISLGRMSRIQSPEDLDLIQINQANGKRAPLRSPELVDQLSELILS